MKKRTFLKTAGATLLGCFALGNKEFFAKGLSVPASVPIAPEAPIDSVVVTDNSVNYKSKVIAAVEE